MPVTRVAQAVHIVRSVAIRVTMRGWFPSLPFDLLLVPPSPSFHLPFTSISPSRFT
jgi:hypothetical protein